MKAKYFLACLALFVLLGATYAFARAGDGYETESAPLTAEEEILVGSWSESGKDKEPILNFSSNRWCHLTIDNKKAIFESAFFYYDAEKSEYVMKTPRGGDHPVLGTVRIISNDPETLYVEGEFIARGRRLVTYDYELVRVGTTPKSTPKPAAKANAANSDKGPAAGAPKTEKAAPPVPEKEKNAFSPAELKRMGTFLSNFTELYLFSLDVKKLTDEDLVSFGIGHNYINNYRTRIQRCAAKDCPHGSLTVDAKHVAESIKKYFDIDFKKHASVKSAHSPSEQYKYYYDGKLYHLEGGDGEARFYARVDSAVKNSSGQIVMTGEIYSEPYDEDEEEEVLGKFEALAKPHKFGGKDTWSIISLSTERYK